MEDTIKSLPNDCVGIICRLNDNKNNTYIIVPEEISLGKIDQEGLFKSENGEYRLHAVEDFESYPEDELYYCYLTSVESLRAMYPNITETTMLMVKYYQEIASQINLLLCDKGEVEIYRAPYSSISKNIGGTLSKRFEDNQEAEKQNAPSIYLPDNTVKTLDSIDALDLENYLKSCGIEVYVGKNNARGNKGYFKVKGADFRIDIAKGQSEDVILKTLAHEFAHFVHYYYDKSLKI
jgi:hypothetical protein